jgi:putative ABC transport system substrate-binding protein
MQRLSRRQIVLGAGSAALLAGCGRLPWQAQQSPKVPRVGYLLPGRASAVPETFEAFRQGLRERGYVEGNNIVVEWRDGSTDSTSLRTQAFDLASLPVDVIVAVGVAIGPAAEATAITPIVMVNAMDPVGQGFVESLARPGTRMTGLSLMQTQLMEKRVELLKMTAPAMSRLAYVRGRNPMANAAEDAARTLGLELLTLEIESADDVDGVLLEAARKRVDGLLVIGHIGTIMRREHIAEFAVRNRLPTMYDRRQFVDAGGLMAYGPSQEEAFRRAAYYVDRILKGTKPADLPVEQPMTFEFVVNMKTARELGITFPHEIALQITEVIE